MPRKFFTQNSQSSDSQSFLSFRYPMEDFSVPSFSLGLDLDISDLSTEGEEDDGEAVNLPLQSYPDQLRNGEESLHESSIQESEETGHETLVDFQVQEEDPPPRLFKRLRRGPPSAPVAEPGAGGCEPAVESPPMINLCDEIEQFSSPEKQPKRCTDDYPSAQSYITCSNTKFSLLHRGFIKDNSEGKQRASKATPASCDVSTLTKLPTNIEKNIFPRITISPIRRINLIDSDSDDSPAVNRDKCRKNEETSTPMSKGKHFQVESSVREETKERFSASRFQTESFWKDFVPPTKNSRIDTPALDDFCKEYFSSMKDQQDAKQHMGQRKPSCFSNSIELNKDHLIDGWDLSEPQPPAYQYFNHPDSRIRALARQRLPHFIPLGAKTDDEAQRSGAENIDYMGQFNTTFDCGKARKVAEKPSRSSSSKKQNKRSYCNGVVEASDATMCWVNPRSKATAPKDAGKRRVSADGVEALDANVGWVNPSSKATVPKGAGKRRVNADDHHQSSRWFTGQDGRKVYVSKDGEQSTGRTAYSKYRKENGGFRKPKKKGAVKKSRKSRT